MEAFRTIPFQQVKRIIGFIDTEPQSPTFGCADRYYWHYKLHDYHNARMQEACLLLAFFYLDKGADLCQNEKLFNLIKGVIGFWAKNLNQNGSVNEIFPHEQSFCASAFSLYAVTETIGLLDLKAEKETHQKEWEKCGDWLMKNGNWHISNQIAASALALYNLGELTREERFTTEARNRIERLLAGREQGGYFKEYGGFDLGYNTLTMSLLAQIYLKNKDERIKTALVKSNELIAKYLDAAGNYDCSAMSRGTAFLYPFSFKVTNSPILDTIKQGLAQDRILNPNWLDDRYLIGLANDYVLTYYS